MGNFIEMTGKQFGRLVVIKRVKNGKTGMARWLCQCRCGKEREVYGADLRSGHTQSCGCLKRELTSRRQLIDMIGKRYGRWTVISRGEDSRKKAPWLCRCECGTVKIVRLSHLRGNASKSCGCLNSEMTAMRNRSTPSTKRLAKGEAAFNCILSGIRSNARTRGLEWSLARAEVRILTSQNCYYCGAEPKLSQYHKGCYGQYPSNGLDRLNSNQGYHIKNVVPCCKACNYAKRSMTPDEFKAWVCRVYEHYAKN